MMQVEHSLRERRGETPAGGGAVTLIMASTQKRRPAEFIPIIVLSGCDRTLCHSHKWQMRGKRRPTGTSTASKQLFLHSMLASAPTLRLSAASASTKACVYRGGRWSKCKLTWRHFHTTETSSSWPTAAKLVKTDLYRASMHPKRSHQMLCFACHVMLYNSLPCYPFLIRSQELDTTFATPPFPFSNHKETRKKNLHFSHGGCWKILKIIIQSKTYIVSVSGSCVLLVVNRRTLEKIIILCI